MSPSRPPAAANPPIVFRLTDYLVGPTYERMFASLARVGAPDRIFAGYPVWSSDETFEQAVDRLRDDLIEDGFVFSPAVVESALLDTVAGAFESRPHAVRRDMIRGLVAFDRIGLIEYARWLAHHGDSSSDPAAAEVDAELLGAPFVRVAGPSIAVDHQRAARDHALQVMADAKVPVVCAFIASQVRQAGGHAVAEHAVAWEAAAAAAMDALREAGVAVDGAQLNADDTVRQALSGGRSVTAGSSLAVH